MIHFMYIYIILSNDNLHVTTFQIFLGAQPAMSPRIYLQHCFTPKSKSKFSTPQSCMR